MPPDKLRPLSSSQMNEFLFGSGLSYEDVIENFYAWEHQAIIDSAENPDQPNCEGASFANAQELGNCKQLTSRKQDR
jgi:hypothetical protein